MSNGQLEQKSGEEITARDINIGGIIIGQDG